ncbi:MAG: hypothetical protein PUK32_05670 [Sutterella sp.]|nr:hypothetical protein [Sutterella sp.]MDD7427800.1 hypothetical protein [Sutterella sp.]MDY3273763.1 hypothetical protein [Duodenibacillus sp.]
MNALEVFISGLRKGAAIGVRFMLPSLIAAFVVIEMLQVSGVLRLLAEHVSGVMAVFGLPGEALAVLIAAWASAAGAIGMVAGLASRGLLTPEHVAILLPGILLMGSQLQFFGRILAVAGVSSERVPVMMAIGLMNAVGAMLIMRFLIF